MNILVIIIILIIYILVLFLIRHFIAKYLLAHVEKKQEHYEAIDVVIPWSGETTDKNRYDHGTEVEFACGTNRDDGIIKYTIRSICKNLPWVRNIIVFMEPPTDNISFIENEREEIKARVKFVDRSKYFINADKNCPSMNYYAVLVNIHRIPFLSEKWLELDDDIIIVRPMKIKDFFGDNSIKLDTNFKADSLYGNDEEVIVPESGSVDTRHTVKLPLKLPKQMNLNGNSHRIKPHLKSTWRKMYNEYTEWFNFVSSHRTRFCFTDWHKEASQEDPLDGSCYFEDTDCAYFWYMNQNDQVINKKSNTSGLIYDDLDLSSSELAGLIKNSTYNQLNINDTVVWESNTMDPEQFNDYKGRCERLHNALEIIFPY